MNLSIEDIKRKLVHIQIRPTYENINSLSIILKNLGYQNIPKIQSEQYKNYYTITKDQLENFCNKINDIILYEPDDLKSCKKNNFKEVFMFKESTLLPKNVYVSEKDNEEKIEDQYLDDVTSISESENSENSDKDELPEEEGYELYSEVSDEDYSD